LHIGRAIKLNFKSWKKEFPSCRKYWTKKEIIIAAVVVVVERAF